MEIRLRVTSMATGDTKIGAGAHTSPDGGSAAAVPPSARPQPQPWTRPEDREGWEVVARGRDRRDRPAVGTALFVELSPDQAAWVREAAGAAGVTQVEIVRRLIDQARAGSEAAGE